MGKFEKPNKRAKKTKKHTQYSYTGTPILEYHLVHVL